MHTHIYGVKQTKKPYFYNEMQEIGKESKLSFAKHFFERGCLSNE